MQSTLGTAYALERELGGGGMSRVFLATETALGRTVVIKVLPPELRGVVSVERFRREVRLAARLRHPHVVPLLAAGDADGVPYYTMPFVEGESLRGRLSRDGAFSVSESVRLLRDVADALAYAHGQGLVHRDLKPENILLERGHAVVTDFGIAKALSNAALDDASDENGGTLTTAGLAVGTPAYMAPEQALADPTADHRVDLYALGCIAYEILAGASPFAASSPQAVVAAHIAATPPALAERRLDAPPTLARLVMRLLEKRPEDRPANAEEVVRALDTLDIHASPLPGMASSATIARETRSPRTLRIAAVLLAMAVIAAAVVLVSRARTRHEPTAPLAARNSTSANVAAYTATAAVTSIAVLPLVNVGGDTAQEYFADGMTDELTGALAR
ncbi:MAG: serine/threonine-protein kinase, partial [Gemmatimonadota bacterium]